MTAAERSYLARYRRHRGAILRVGALSALQTATVVPYALLARYLFDRAIPDRNLKMLALAAAGMAALNLANSAVVLAIRGIALSATKLVTAEIRVELIRKVYTLSRRYLTGRERSRLHSRIVTDSERVDVMSNALAAQLLPAIAGAATLSGALVWLNWKLFATMLAFYPLGRLLTGRLGRKLRTRALEFRGAFEEFSRGTAFVLQSVDLARMQNAERGECERQAKIVDDVRRKSREMAWLDTAYGLAHGNVTLLSSIGALALGGAFVARGGMSLGELLAFYLCASLLNGHTRTIVGSWPHILAGGESLEAVDEILRSEETEPYRGTQRIEFAGSVEYRGVTFGYGEEPVLRDFDLSVGGGETVALIGANGSGKTTALHLLCGFYRPQRGALFVKDVAYDEVDMRDVRRSIAVVSQDALLFPGTIHENIAYGDGSATREEVREAARRATADRFIEALPRGYDTSIGDNGVLLSGGERQKIAIARALVGRPKLLVLDEPTNHLDAASVRRLMRNLAESPDAPPMLLVSHDLEVAGEADRVYELRGGRLFPREDLWRPKAAIAQRGGRK
jgi:ABC-type bacteriocin/lantibiotic exporter with double-glycine peptidase domain